MGILIQSCSRNDCCETIKGLQVFNTVIWHNTNSSVTTGQDQWSYEVFYTPNYLGRKIHSTSFGGVVLKWVKNKTVMCWQCASLNIFPLFLPLKLSNWGNHRFLMRYHCSLQMSQLVSLILDMLPEHRDVHASLPKKRQVKILKESWSWYNIDSLRNCDECGNSFEWALITLAETNNWQHDTFPYIIKDYASCMKRFEWITYCLILLSVLENWQYNGNLMSI